MCQAGRLGMAVGGGRTVWRAQIFKKKMCVPDSSEGQSRGWLDCLIGKESSFRRGAAVNLSVEVELG